MTIDKRTVLVLGAGASKPYGYPLGSELKNMLQDVSHFSHLIQKNQYSRRDITAFCQAFMLSGMPSIDAFLSRRGSDKLFDGPTIEEIGKVGISLAIRRSVTYESLFQKRERAGSNAGKSIDWEDHWYAYLWGMLTDGVKPSNLSDFNKHKLSIVTFNYDHSLEHFLYTAMRNAYHIGENAAAELLSEIPFIHVYGSLSGNPFSDSYPYSFDLNRHDNFLEDDLKQITVIDEDRENGLATFDQAYKILESAERICFLGFGYDPMNVARLMLPDLITARILYAVEIGEHRWPTWVFSSVGMLPVERETLVQSLTMQAGNKDFHKNPQLASEKIEQIAERFHKYADHKSRMTLRHSQVLSP
jgi:hypothetical protein